VSEIEVFAPTGVLSGETDRVPLMNAGPDLTRSLAIDEARWYPLDGSVPSHRGDTTIPPDDILIVVTPEPELRVHMAHYAVTLDVGPYRVAGQLATHPGFDPARSIARPSSTFVALSDATIELIDQAGAGLVQRPYLHVNRYAVERVTSSLMLGHFFPGARLVAQEAATVASA
jgi:hypothetical protein